MGRSKLATRNMPWTERAGEPDTHAVAFVRPHDIRISREPGGQATLAARVIRCNTAGPFAHLELERLDNDG